MPKYLAGYTSSDYREYRFEAPNAGTARKEAEEHTPNVKREVPNPFPIFTLDSLVEIQEQKPVKLTNHESLLFKNKR